MRKDIKTLVYDEELHLEAYRFEGIDRPFPNHFHDYYVIGFIEQGAPLMVQKPGIPNRARLHPAVQSRRHPRLRSDRQRRLRLSGI